MASLDIQGHVSLPFGGSGFGLSVFLGCDPKEAVRLERVSYIASFRAGDVIAGSNIDMPFYGIVERGAARSYITKPAGRQYSTGLVLQGQLIPPVMPAKNKSIRTVEATRDTLLHCIPAKQIHLLLCESGKMGAAFSQLIAQAIESNGNWVALLGRRTVGEKIAAFLVLLMEHATEGERQGDPRRIEIPLSRSHMADFLGVSNESVSRVLTSLKQARIIRFWNMRDIEVLQPRRLLELAGEPEAASSSASAAFPPVFHPNASTH